MSSSAPRSPRSASRARCAARRAVGAGRVLAGAMAGLIVALALLALTSAPVAAQTAPPATEPADPAAETTVDPAATTLAPTTTVAPTTTTTLRPAVCDDVAPTVAQFVGTVTATGPDSIQFRIDEVRSGAPDLQTAQVLYVRDARFLKDGHRYLVTASRDTETNLLVSKVRTKRNEDPRCTAKDPIYTREADGTPVDTGVFAGVKGHRRDIAMAFLKPLGAVLAVLVALVLVKYLLYFSGKGIRRLVSGPTPR